VAFDWFRSYLTDREQCTEFGSIISPKLPIVCGVPQGSILGPLLFLLYINDIINGGNNSKLLLFADDTNVFLEHDNYDELIKVAETELNNISHWLLMNKLSLNVGKTKFMIFQTPRKLLPSIPTIKINSENVEKVTEIKFLGVFIDELMNWKFHIVNKSKVITKNLAVIHRIKNLVPTQTRKTLYYSLIHPHLSYGVLAWGNTHSKEIKHL